MQRTIVTTVTTTRHFTKSFTGEDLRVALGLPHDASIEFQVPGGGDWSNMSICITEDHPVTASWTHVEEETDTE